MSSFSKSLRTLGLAAALIGATAAPSFAEGYYQAGPVAVAGWKADSRTPLAASASSQTETPAQRMLERSGATGGGGQHK